MPPSDEHPSSHKTADDAEPATHSASDHGDTSPTPAPLSAAREPAYLADVPLIPREILFGNPDKAGARISPDGTQISFLAPVDGVLNVWVGPVDDPAAARAVTSDTQRGIRIHFWAFTSRHLLYLQDIGGDEDWHVYCVDLSNHQTKDLTPLPKVNAQIQEVSHLLPEEILVKLNDRNPQLHDVHRVNIVTGERKLVEENAQGFVDYLSDDDFNLRFATRFNPDGGNELFRRTAQGDWESFLKIPMEDTLTTSPVGLNRGGDALYLIDSRGRNTGALMQWNLASGAQELIAENDLSDIGGALVHPVEKTIDAVSFNYLRKEWQVLNPAVAGDLEYLRTVADGEIEITSQSLDNRRWTVAFLLDDGPARTYLHDRDAGQAKFLFSNRDALKGLPLVKMHSLVIPARDGLPLVSYLTLPPGTDQDGDGRPTEPVPLVLNVHGGPWARDAWGLDPEAQWLSNRGYATLSVNFRGSTGFGKAFLNAGNQEWAGKMHDDLIDAVRWAIDQKIADPRRVAIMGGSYGGYATLTGLTFTPDVFACGVDIVGPSNILTLLGTIPAYWQPMIQMFKDRVGDFTSDAGKALLTERSPLTHVDRIQRPLLIGQGANDPRVKQSEADQIVEMMNQKKIPVTYVLYPDEGHGFARPPNRLSFNAVTEAFLATHLGGRFEPIGSSFEGSTIRVPSGADQVPGLKEALGGEPGAQHTGYRLLASDKGRVAMVGLDGEIEWETPIQGDAHDLWLLPGGNVLFPASSTRIVEMAPDQSIVWEYTSRPKDSQTPRVEVHAFQRLEGELTMIAESGNQRIIEVDRQGRIVHEIPLTVDHPDPHRDTRMVRRLANGHYLVCHEGDGKVREYDRDGNVAWSYTLDLNGRPPSPGHGPEGHGVSVFGAVRLENGHTLIAGGNNNRVIEVDPAGNIVWSLDQKELPGVTLAWVTSLHALPNGNIILGNCHAGESNPQLLEVTREKKVVWTFHDFKNFGNSLAVAHLLGLPEGTRR